jgi:hypothetical protein
MRLREQRIDDYAGVVAVLGRNGLRNPTREQWDCFWNDSPYRRQLEHVPFGWVLEHDSDGIVGTFRNASFLYEWNERPVRAVVASAWAVDHAHRHRSLSLAKAFFSQSGVEVLLNTTAVLETSGRAFLAFRAERVPQPTYTTRMLWITGYRGFAAHSLKERGLPGAAVLQYPAAAGGWIAELPRRSGRATAGVCEVSAFDARFDRFWAVQRTRTDRLQAVRDAAALRWRFALERDRPLIVVRPRADDIDGYAVLVYRNQDDLQRLEIVDLQARDDDPEVLRTVVGGALRIARDRAVHLVAMTGHGEPKRRALMALHPHFKTTPGWPLYYKAADAALEQPLKSSNAWDLSLYDGDALWSAMFESSSNAAS